MWNKKIVILGTDMSNIQVKSNEVQRKHSYVSEFVYLMLSNLIEIGESAIRLRAIKFRLMRPNLNNTALQIV